MAKFEGVKWAPRQMRYLLPDKQFGILEPDAKVFGVSRSTFYATFLCFEGIRFFAKKNGTVWAGYKDPEFYCFPQKWIRDHHTIFESGWQKVHTKNQDIDSFKNEKGFELIASDLGIPYPSQ